MMHVQAHRAQVRQASFAHEIADGISLRELSLYRGACYPTSVMAAAARFNSVIRTMATSPKKEVDPR
jgi:hypothetical protein